jgi:hypothetical protein
VFAAGCGESAGERLIKDNIHLINEYAAEFEFIATVPPAAEVRQCQQRISKIESQMKANNEALQQLPLARIRELAGKHQIERDEAKARLTKALQPFANAKKGIGEQGR